jgi:hypothetical protein
MFTYTSYYSGKKILLCLPPSPSIFNGELIRFGGVGVSGTHQTFVIIAEGFASNGFDVDLYCPTSKPGINMGVNYINSLDDIDYINTNILIGTVLEEIKFHKPFLNLKKVLISFQIDNEDGKEFYSYLHVERIYVFPSEWTQKAHETLEGQVIYNPLMDDILLQVKEKSENTFSWTASWERGGEISKKVSDKLGGHFNKMNYYLPNESFDKTHVFKNLSESKYFVYPLVLPDTRVHKDTFACCVAEALAMGTHVITWPIAALPELYGDGSGIHFVDIPSDCNKELLENYEYASEPNLLKESVVDLFANKVKEIGNQQVDYELWRNKFNSKDIVKQWIELF